MKFMLAAVLAATSCASVAHAQDVPPAPEADEEEEDIVVQATRSGRRVQDEPIRVEVLGREEIEEKLLMRPGNIAMLVNETGGVRVQVTSPALGAANIRVQGMAGRYTQLLADGLPLYGGQASSLGLLQVAPADLGQVEVIKGAASALYGPTALGGVINLVSRRPGDAAAGELILNATSRDGQDATAYFAAPANDRLGYSVIGGFHRQSRTDLDRDGWGDIPGYDRWTVRPRLFWADDGGASAFVTLGAMHEDRRGGTLPGRTVAGGTPFPQNQRTDRLDAGLVAQVPTENIGMLHLRASAMEQDHRHRFGALVENDRHRTLFAETSLADRAGATSWVAGLAYQQDSYRSRTFPAFDYSYRNPAAFAQVEHDATADLTLAGSARLDAHSEYGTRFSPRLSVLYRPDPVTVRASFGSGFFAPTPFVEEIEAAGLSRLAPLSGLTAERAHTASVDFGYAQDGVEGNLVLFASDVHDATRLAPDGPGRVRLINQPGTTRVRGSELLLRYRAAPFTVTGSYVFTAATEPRDGGVGRQRVALTPRHAAGMVAMWERHGKGRIGFEAYYTGRQALEDNPYRLVSKPYVELGLLGEIVLGRFSLFVNAENLLDVRQSRYDPIPLPRRADDGRWTVDVWAPTDGFIVNGGVRVRFGGS